MARTTLADVNFQSSAFRDTMSAVWTHKLGVLNAMMTEAPDVIIPSNTKGITVSIPKWNTITGTWQTIATGLSTTFNKLADYLDVGVWVEREVAFQAEDILLTVAGNQKDVTVQVASQLGEFIAHTLNGLGMSVLQGVFASTLATSHSTGDAYKDGIISYPAVLGAKTKFGDNMSRLSAFVSNSKVVSDAINSRLTMDFRGTPTADSGAITTLLGMTPYMTDLLTAVAGVYSSYLSTAGSIIYKFRERPQAQYTFSNKIRVGNIEIELVRDAVTAGGIDGLIIRFSGLVHIPGVAWNGTVASNPTDAQLATGANWTKVAPDDKLIPIIELKTL